MSKQTFETRATDLLTNPGASSVDFEAMVREAEVEAAHYDHELARCKESLLDPSLAPDPRVAMEAVQVAEAMAARCRALRTRLEQAWRQALSNEYREKFLARQQKARVQRDAASAKFARVRDLLAELVEIFQEAEAADKLVREANGDAPAGESSRLLTVECHARGLEDGFTRERPSLMGRDGVRLLDFDTGAQVWPVIRRIDPAYYARDGRRFADDCGPDWWKKGAAEADAKAQREQHELAEADRQRKQFYGLER